MVITNMHKSALLSLVAVEEAVAQNTYSNSVELPLSLDAVVKGEMLNFKFFSEGGAILVPAGKLMILTADPAVAAGDTAITAAERNTVIGQVPVAVSDWQADSNGASAEVASHPVSFSPATSLWLAWFHEDATAINSSSADQETLQVVVNWRNEQ